jgi:hypothetical protein
MTPGNTTPGSRALRPYPLALPKGTLLLQHGRTLQPIIGYDIRSLAPNRITRDSILASAGWQHSATGLVVSAGIEDTGRWGPLLHVSISYPDHDPTWEEIKAVRDLFFLDSVDAMMMLPRQEDYINVHPHCFHLWQTPEDWRLL